MNADVLRKAGVDYDGGVKRFMGRTQLYEKLLLKFPRDTTIERIREAYAAGDEQALIQSAHEFKGMCGNIALTQLYGAADALVKLLRGAYSEAERGAAYDRLEMEYHIANEAICAATEVPQ